jgi:asparagine N-glycosylation enzyme membrane subunit Stt3
MNPWILISLFSALAFWLRTSPRYYQVFGTPGLVNFTETDAWFHVRTIEHMARNFPHRLTIDPYGRIDGGQVVNTGIFFDLPAAFIGWALQLSPASIHTLAAWYPAVLGMLLVPVTFLCGRAIINEKAGLWAAAVAATLPGHFLHTGSLGFTDHHVMEALLTTTLLWLLTREPSTSPLLLGATLAAYLLTFSGGSFVVALITLWYWVEAARTPQSPPDSRRFAIACLVAAPLVTLRLHAYLGRYSLAAVLLAAAVLWLLPMFSRWCGRLGRPRVWYLGISALTGAAVMLVLSIALAGQESLLGVLGRMVAAGETASTVNELRSLTNTKGYFSLEEAWNQFGAVFIFVVAALPLLAESVWRRPNAKHTLLLIWSLTFFVMSMSQVRMIYYFGVSAALLTGYIMGRLQVHPVAIGVLGAALILPNLNQAYNDTDTYVGQVSPDWQEALTFLRERTPEPFGDPAVFNGFPSGPAANSVLAWWDYGYWISTIAHRVPVTNPTQNNVEPAADFLLATEIPAARDALSRARAGYVVVNQRLPFISDGRMLRGYFLNFFAYAPRQRRADFVHDVRETNESGRLGRTLFFRANYFRTMLFRLYFAGGEAKVADDRGNFAVITLNGDRVEAKQQFTSLAAAKAAAQLCGECELVSENPFSALVDLEAVPIVEPVFNSTTTAARWQNARRAEVQIYRVR